MGMLISSLLGSLFGSKEVRILILGLDSAGKSTILYKLHSPDAVIHTVPTIGFNVETLHYKNLKFQVWDLGGQTNIRSYWRCYYPNTNGIIFVVDSTDVERLEIAKKELMGLLGEDELKDSVLLVFANKQDLPGALSAADISEAMGLSSIKDHSWFICKTCAVKGEGLHEGLDWLAEQLKQR
jgi:ADP-ribosylation factor-like protein 1